MKIYFKFIFNLFLDSLIWKTIIEAIIQLTLIACTLLINSMVKIKLVKKYKNVIERQQYANKH